MLKKPVKSRTGPPAAPKVEGPPPAWSRNLRETIESVAIAFILAFLFRTFEAEAFVIPTGSMAPTLQGRHKDVFCPQCDYRYQANTSKEDRDAFDGGEVVSITCPMCRFVLPVDPAWAWHEDPMARFGARQRSYSGDRILVGKFVYEFGEPQRWDVIVFKYPGEATTNYIKRLVGLPNEDVMIRHGDIFTKPRGADPSEYRIARKGHKLLPMLQVVHDNHYTPAFLVQSNWPMRWQVWEPAVEQGGWTSEDHERRGNIVRVFSTDGTAPQDVWIRYQHLPPAHHDWLEMEQGPLPPNYEVRPQLITDFYAYNAVQTRGRREILLRVEPPHPQRAGMHWVGDLMVEAEVEVRSASGIVMLDLVEGGRHLRAEVDVATGQAALSIDDLPDFAPTASTRVKGAGSYKLGFANVDDKLHLWVNGREVEFDQPTTFTSPDNLVPTEKDLAPVGLGTRGAAVTVNRLRVLRDIYYVASSPRLDMIDYPYPLVTHDHEELQKFLSDPAGWGIFARRRAIEFPMEDDQFFALGDNSPESRDSRLWGNDHLGHYVDRKLLIGKALFIYWPHSWDRVPGTPIPFPFFPNFQDMGLVR